MPLAMDCSPACRLFLGHLGVNKRTENYTRTETFVSMHSFMMAISNVCRNKSLRRLLDFGRAFELEVTAALDVAFRDLQGHEMKVGAFSGLNRFSKGFCLPIGALAPTPFANLRESHLALSRTQTQMQLWPRTRVTG